MTRDEFWHGDPWLVQEYHDIHMLQTERKNNEFWLLGRYITEGVGIVMHNLHRDSKKGQKAKDYPEKPHRITPMTEAEKAEELRAKRQKVVDFFTGFAKDFNEKKERLS